MQHPIYRDTLLNSRGEYHNVLRERNLESIVDTIYTTVLHEASIGRTHYQYLFAPNANVNKKYVVNRLRNLFPDSDVDIDPLHTYVLVRWQ